MPRPKTKRVDYATNWKEMAGDTVLEKKLNSYLTHQFIWKQDVPEDECLHEAREIISLVTQYAEKEVKDA